MGTYRPYSKTLYWTCWSAATFAIFAVFVFWHFHTFRILASFAHFAFQIPRISAHLVFSWYSHFRAFRIYRVFRIFAHFTYFMFQIPRIFAHLTNYAQLAIPHSSQFAHSHISQASHSRAFRIFCILVFFAFRHALPRASLGSIAFRSHVLSSSSKVHWCVSHLVSLALYHICPCIHIYVHLYHYVFILHHPCMFSATYSAPRPGNSLSMLTRQRIVRSFYWTSLPSLGQLVSRTLHQKNPSTSDSIVAFRSSLKIFSRSTSTSPSVSILELESPAFAFSESNALHDIFALFPVLRDLQRIFMRP